MTVSKSWAYINEFGSETITAWAITQERAKYGNEPLKKTYWSNHPAGRRKRVKQVQRGRATFFSYYIATDATGSCGESLSHRLLKESIAGLANTRLKLGKYGEHDITITHGEMEKVVVTPKGKFFTDACLRFSSISTLGLRWSGEVYIEIKHTHPVPVEKQKALLESRIPVVEVDLTRIFLYPYEDEITTDPLERAHVARIRNMLQKGFLPGRVISDRRSVEFLEQEAARWADERQQALKGLEDTNAANTKLSQELGAATSQIAALEARNRAHAQSVASTEAVYRSLKERFDAETEKVRALNGALNEANAAIATQQGDVRFAYWIVGVTLAGLIGIAGVFVYQRIFVESPITQAEPVRPVAPPAVASPSGSAKNLQRASVPRSHRAPASAAANERRAVNNGSR